MMLERKQTDFMSFIEMVFVMGGVLISTIDLFENVINNFWTTFFVGPDARPPQSIDPLLLDRKQTNFVESSAPPNGVTVLMTENINAMLIIYSRLRFSETLLYK